MPPDRQDYLPFGRPDFGESEIDAVSAVLRSGWVGMGPETEAFERELADACGVTHVVTVNSCTSALFLALLAKGVGPGDEVICPSLTWCSTATVVRHLGADVVFADVDSASLCLTAEAVRACLTAKTRAAIVVHFGGLTADVAGLRSVLPDDVSLIEDAAHAFGSRFPGGAAVGASGNPTCFSFYANKNLATGEGGAIAVAGPALAERLRRLRLHGLESDAWRRFAEPGARFSPVLRELGYKMNFTDLQAAIGRVQLRRQPEFAARRSAIARLYVEALTDLSPRLACQSDILSDGHSRHLFAVLLPLEEMAISRDDVVAALRARNIGASIHYAPLHRMPVLAGDREWHLPVTDDICRRNLTLPISASMTTEDAGDVIRALRDVMESSGT